MTNVSSRSLDAVHCIELNWYWRKWYIRRLKHAQTSPGDRNIMLQEKIIGFNLSCILAFWRGQVKCADLQRHLTVGHFRQEICRTSLSSYCETSFLAGTWNVCAKEGSKKEKQIGFAFLVIKGYPTTTPVSFNFFSQLSCWLLLRSRWTSRMIHVNIIEARSCYSSVTNPSFPPWIQVQKICPHLRPRGAAARLPANTEPRTQ